MTQGWVTVEIEEIKTVNYQTRVIYELKLKSDEEGFESPYDTWTISTSSKVQKPGLILNKQFGYSSTFLHHDIGSDDFNDLILDKEGKGKHFVIRQDVIKSLLYIDLANYFDSLGVFERII